MNPIVTPKFRVSYPKVFKPELNKLNNQMEFSVVALFKKGEDLSKLIAAAEEALVKEFGANKALWPKNLRNPFRDQAEKAKDVEGKRVLPNGYEEGAIFLTLRTKHRPGVVDENAQPIMDETQFYAGCYAKAALSVYAYKKGQNPGVNFGLTHIQKVADGEPFSGRPSVESCFAPVTNAATGTQAKSAIDIFG